MCISNIDNPVEFMNEIAGEDQRDPIADSIRAGQASADKFMDLNAAKLAMFDELVDSFAFAIERSYVELPYCKDVLARAQKLQEQSK